MLVIRLARTGRSKYPTYRIVAAEAARTATGKFVAVLGHYNPHTKDLVVKREEIQKHLSNGAQPSNTVVKLLIREKLELPKWVKLKTKAPKASESTSAEKSPPTPDAQVTDAEAAADSVAEDVAPATEEVEAEASGDNDSDTSK